MISFENDYSEGCSQAIWDLMTATNMTQTTGYGMDEYCDKAKELIRSACGADVFVEFMVGGTQVNKTVLATILRPWEGVISADTGHINVHETGAVEATGHKVLQLPAVNGKISAEQIDACCKHGFNEHVVTAAAVYISQPTEYGTLYSLSELKAIRAVCDQYELKLFIDGARMAYGLMTPSNDVTLQDLSRLADVFYIGGTKCGALFGEAVVIPNKALVSGFRNMIKQTSGLLAKGRLLGIQFIGLFENGLYFENGRHGIQMAEKIRAALEKLNIEQTVPSPTNQLFILIPNDKYELLKQDFVLCDNSYPDDTHTEVRICTSWATKEENVDALISALEKTFA